MEIYFLYAPMSSLFIIPVFIRTICRYTHDAAVSKSAREILKLGKKKLCCFFYFLISILSNISDGSPVNYHFMLFLLYTDVIDKIQFN